MKKTLLESRHICGLKHPPRIYLLNNLEVTVRMTERIREMSMRRGLSKERTVVDKQPSNGTLTRVVLRQYLDAVDRLPILSMRLRLMITCP